MKLGFQDVTQDALVDASTEVCTSKSDTLVTTLGPARQVCVFAHQENCQIGHSSRNTFLPGVSALSLLPPYWKVRRVGRGAKPAALEPIWGPAPQRTLILPVLLLPELLCPCDFIVPVLLFQLSVPVQPLDWS
jgi:hypothetical protein